MDHKQLEEFLREHRVAVIPGVKPTMLNVRGAIDRSADGLAYTRTIMGEPHNQGVAETAWYKQRSIWQRHTAMLVDDESDVGEISELLQEIQSLFHPNVLHL